MAERWDCIYIDRVDSNERIYLTQPQEYGLMRRDQKVTKSVLTACGRLKGSSNETKILVATAMTTAFNRTNLKSSTGLIIRGFEGRTPVKGLQTVIIEIQRKSLRVKESTGWVVYISPEERFYSIINGRYKGDELTQQQSRMIHSCVDYLLNRHG